MVAIALKTPNLHLRPLIDADQPFYCRLYTDATVMRHVGPPLPPESAQRAFARVLRQIAAVPARSHYWILCAPATGEALGLMALVPDLDDAGSAEVGVLLLPDAQGCGYATEAIAALADRVFADSGLQKLWTRHASGHAAAIGLMHRLGFVANAGEAAVPTQPHWQLLRPDWRRGDVRIGFPAPFPADVGRLL